MMRFLLLALVILAGPAAGRPLHAQELEQVVQSTAAAWGRGDAAAVVALAARGGIAVDVDGNGGGPVAARQAAAMLRRIFDDRETVELRTGTARVVDGSPARGYGEFVWAARARGTSIPERRTVFIGFVRQDDGWRITQIRMMP
jgi:ketosteroid isomerase-like protein